MARNTINKEVALKEEFHYVAYKDELMDAWCSLHVETGLFTDFESAKTKLQSMLDEDRDFFENHFLFVENENGELVASAGLWPGNDFENNRYRLHYVSVSQSAQHNKIAQSMISKLCILYDSIPSKYPLYVSTQSQSYGAIVLYTKMGFHPYLGEYNGCSQKENEKAWEFVTQVLKEKA